MEVGLKNIKLSSPSLQSIEGPHKWWRPSAHQIPLFISHYCYKLSDTEEEIKKHLRYLFPEHVSDLLNMLYLHAVQRKVLPSSYINRLEEACRRLLSEKICPKEYLDVPEYMINLLKVLVQGENCSELEISSLKASYDLIMENSSKKAFFLCVKHYFLANFETKMDEQMCTLEEMKTIEPNFYLWHLLYYNCHRFQQQKLTVNPSEFCFDHKEALERAIRLQKGTDPDPFCTAAKFLFVSNQLRGLKRKGVLVTIGNEQYDADKVVKSIKRIMKQNPLPPVKVMFNFAKILSTVLPGAKENLSYAEHLNELCLKATPCFAYGHHRMATIKFKKLEHENAIAHQRLSYKYDPINYICLFDYLMSLLNDVKKYGMELEEKMNSLLDTPLDYFNVDSKIIFIGLNMLYGIYFLLSDQAERTCNVWTKVFDLLDDTLLDDISTCIDMRNIGNRKRKYGWKDASDGAVDVVLEWLKSVEVGSTCLKNIFATACRDLKYRKGLYIPPFRRNICTRR